MHLGFQIYAVGFQSPNAEAARPMVYVITLLLVLIVLAVSSVAIYLRNRMRKTLADSNDMTRTHDGRTRDITTMPGSSQDRRLRRAAAAPRTLPPQAGAPRTRRSSQVRRPVPLLRPQPGPEGHHHGLPPQPGHGPDRPLGLRQVDALRCLNRMNDLIDDVRTTGSILRRRPGDPRPPTWT